MFLIFKMSSQETADFPIVAEAKALARDIAEDDGKVGKMNVAGLPRAINGV